MKRILGIALCAALLVALPAVAGAGGGISNWSAPSTWSAGGGLATGGRTPLAVSAAPLPFIPVTPCRVADTRGNGFTGAYGPPSIGSSGARTFVIPGKCGIPASAVAVSFNFAVWNTTSYGDFNIFPAGAAVSTVSTLNWGPGVLALANAAVIPLGTSGAITVLNESSGTVDLFFDVNGYYASTNSSTAGTFYNVTPAFYGIWGETTATTFNYGVIGEANSGTTGIGTFGRGSQYGVYGTVTGSAIGVFGDSANSNGVLGTTTAGGLAGVLGTNSAATNGSQGVGGFAGGAAKVFGVQGQIGATATAGAAGVHGIGAATSGITFGVLGESPNTVGDSAGVMGRDGSTLPVILGLIGSSGTRGEGQSNGVVGVAGPTGWGVTGLSVNSGGILQQWGRLGVGTTYGVYANGNMGASGTKPFVEPHPTDPTRVIRYVAMEGPEAGTYFRAKATVVAGIAEIEVPETFRIVSDEEGLTVHVTPIGRAQTWIESSDLNKIVIGASRDVTVNVIVYGVRRAYKDWQVVATNTEYVPESPSWALPAVYSADARKRLIENGTYNPDGTVNMKTAERVGWAQKWRDDAAARESAAMQARAAEQASPAAQAAAKVAAEAGRSQTP